MNLLCGKFAVYAANLIAQANSPLTLLLHLLLRVGAARYAGSNQATYFMKLRSVPETALWRLYRPTVCQENAVHLSLPIIFSKLGPVPSISANKARVHCASIAAANKLHRKSQ